MLEYPQCQKKLTGKCRFWPPKEQYSQVFPMEQDRKWMTLWRNPFNRGPKVQSALHKAPISQAKGQR